MTRSEPVLHQATAKDTAAIAAFISEENPESPVSAEYLDWWFFGQDDINATIITAYDSGRIIGVSCTKNYLFNMEGESVLLAMPQKVLTASGARGKGFFSRLYYENEAQNIRKGIDRNITITNAASTPIFLNKFGYRKGRLPELLIIPAVSYIFKRNRCEIIEPGKVRLPASSQKANGIIKTSDYFQWRYLTRRDKDQLILKLNETLYFLKVKQFKNIRTAFFLDYCGEINTAGIKSVCRFLAGKGILQMIAFDNVEHKIKGIPHLRVRNRFNFLVKGKSAEDTERLTGIRFDLTMGDLDFI